MSAKSNGRLVSQCATSLNILPGFSENVATKHLGASSRQSSKLEEMLAFQFQALSLPEPLREYRFYKARRWRFDFAWPDAVLAVEVEGAVWSGGRHTTGTGFTADCEKYNSAAILGWAVLRVTGPMVKSGEAAQIVKQALMSRTTLDKTK